MKYRHGDVVLVKVAALPQDAKLRDSNVLFEGEATGHAHRLMDVGELFETRDGKLYLKLEKPARLDHEEHVTSVIPAGVYFCGQKRQYDEKSGWVTVTD